MRGFFFISIHAPPRGATLDIGEVGGENVFQFTPLREGRRDGGKLLLSTLTEFQFTPLREGRRRLQCRTAGGHIYFNSRPSARGDRQGRSRGKSAYHFNSRPSARGDELLLGGRIVSNGISIHAPPRGATAGRGGRGSASTNFNSRPSARGDAPCAS